MNGLENFVCKDLEKMILDYKKSFETVQKYNSCVNEFNNYYKYYLLSKYDKYYVDKHFSFPSRSDKDIREKEYGNHGYLINEHKQAQFQKYGKLPKINPDHILRMRAYKASFAATRRITDFEFYAETMSDSEYECDYSFYLE